MVMQTFQRAEAMPMSRMGSNDGTEMGGGLAREQVDHERQEGGERLMHRLHPLEGRPVGQREQGLYGLPRPGPWNWASLGWLA